MNRCIALSLVLLLCGLVAQAQQLVVTPEGLRSSIDNSSDCVEYAYKSDSRDKITDFCKKRFASFEFTSYNVEETDIHHFTLSGLMNSISFLVFGTKELAYTIQIELGVATVKVSAKLTKGSGRPLNYKALFSKTGKVKLPPIKGKIEDEINTVIRSVFEDKVIYE